jgi:hypothetical protein
MRGTERLRGVRFALAVTGLLALVACGSQPVTPPAATAAPSATAEASAPGSATPSVPPSAIATTPAVPAVRKHTVTVTRRIPFRTRRVPDSALAAGTTKVRISGRKGVKTLTYEVTLTDGVQTGKRLVRQVVTRAPVTRVVAVGTRKTRQCHPNYSLACVPIASDVDCAGGGGNGPAYVRGPVRVDGGDVYDLDRDGDGIACDT